MGDKQAPNKPCRWVSADWFDLSLLRRGAFICLCLWSRMTGAVPSSTYLTPLSTRAVLHLLLQCELTHSLHSLPNAGVQAASNHAPATPHANRGWELPPQNHEESPKRISDGTAAHRNSRGHQRVIIVWNTCSDTCHTWQCTAYQFPWLTGMARNVLG